MIYVYAITEASGLPLPSVETGRLEVIQVEALAAVCTRRAAGRLEPTAEEVWRHELVVEALMRDRATLPARFGTTFGEEGRLREILRRNGPDLSTALERVRGCVELGVRGVWQRPVAEEVESSVMGGGSSGRAYMMARLARERRRQEAVMVSQQAATAVHEALAPLARDSHVRTRTAIAGAPHHVLGAAYLVERPAMAEFAAAFARRAADLAREAPEVKLLCTGPWPPYHFVPVLQREGDPDV